jgi:hypothetical protein
VEKSSKLVPGVTPCCKCHRKAVEKSSDGAVCQCHLAKASMDKSAADELESPLKTAADRLADQHKD